DIIEPRHPIIKLFERTGCLHRTIEPYEGLLLHRNLFSGKGKIVRFDTTYETPEQLMHPASRFGPYRDAIHITATNSLRDGMEESSNELFRWFHNPVISFADLSRVMGGGWYRPSR
ncbi:hypothetical protein, partial [Bacillus subtilis]